MFKRLIFDRKYLKKQGYLIKVFKSCQGTYGYAGIARQLLPEAFEGAAEILCLKGGFMMKIPEKDGYLINSVY